MFEHEPTNYGSTQPIPALTPGHFRTTFSFGKARENLKGFKRVMFGIVLTALILTYGLEYLGASLLGVSLLELQDPESGMQNQAALVISIVSLIVVPLFTSAAIGASLQRTAGNHVRLAHAASYLKYAPMVLLYTVFWEITSTLGGLISLELGLLIRVVVSVLGSFVVYYIIDQKRSPLTAFTSSARLVLHNFGQVLLMYVYVIVLVFVALLTLGIGLIWVSPLLGLMVSHQYGQANGLHSAAEYADNAAK